ncbi:MAG: asparagine synthetase B, partial [Elusimicrobiota bacterium]|nr:asparagine synthetase B [Elusimicrobiota bacterium]
MCGICGVINLDKEPVSERLVEQMTSTLYHRGPDDKGFYFNNTSRSINVGMGMRRLSIIDLDTGSQPIYSEDNKVVTIFNGEIYNFRELKKSLIQKGHKFHTKTDTEVIVHLWEEHGRDCVKYLNGMFAFAIWDNKRKVFFLTRDRIGQKPLYYTQIGNNFYFSSEIKT